MILREERIEPMISNQYYLKPKHKKQEQMLNFFLKDSRLLGRKKIKKR